jgi:hypothetical protein
MRYASPGPRWLRACLLSAGLVLGLSGTASAVTYPALTQSPSSTQATLDAVSCTPTRDCVAVGTSANVVGNEVTARAQSAPSASFGTYTAAALFSGAATRSGAAAIQCPGTVATCSTAGWSNSGGTIHAHWTWADAIPWAPAGATSSRLRAINGLAAGEYTDGSGVTHGYALGGTGFNSTASPVPVAGSSTLNAIHCSVGCLVLGSAAGTPFIKSFTVALDASGKPTFTWGAPTTVPALSSSYTLQAITCAELRCFIVGYSTASGVKRAVLISSVDRGVNWTLNALPALPAGATASAYNGVSCANKFQCRAVGEVTVGGVTSPYSAAFSANLSDPATVPAGTWSAGTVSTNAAGLTASSLNATSCVTVGSGLTRTARCADVGKGTTTGGATAPVGTADVLWTS